jgi:hypothetical protein
VDELDAGLVADATEPITSTCKEALFGPRAVLTNVVASAALTWLASTEKSTEA